jgi:hypothetical protein
MDLPALPKSIAELVETLMVIPHPLSHLCTSLSCLQVFDEQRWLTGRGYDGRVVRVES